MPECPICNPDGVVFVTGLIGDSSYSVWGMSDEDHEWITCPLCKGTHEIEKTAWAAFHLRFAHLIELRFNPTIEELEQFISDVEVIAG